MMQGSLTFAPLFDWPILLGLTFAFVLLSVLGWWRGLQGVWYRALAAAVLIGALANPSLLQEVRKPLSDIVFLITDETASQSLGDRVDQTASASAVVLSRLRNHPNTEVRQITVSDAQNDGGTEIFTALAEALSAEPISRIAGAVVVTDGQIHDTELAPDMPAPLHVLLTGRPEDWDRRVQIVNAPAYGLLGEPVSLTLRVEDSGAVPVEIGKTADLQVATDGGEAATIQAEVGRDIVVELELPHAGVNVLQFALPPIAGELTDRNNTVVVRINGVRDRLRVLLVSGEPYPGERTWRNLLKSDSSVDLVHFTILRPPEKQDGVPVSELSLIAFPTRELFIEKIDDFDLIIFDRYKRRGILPMQYFENISNFVEKGGAVLIAAGPDFGSADSLFRSPLGLIIPATPTSRVIEQGYLPKVSEIGRRHPVTRELPGSGSSERDPTWGRWFRLVDVENPTGETLMTGAGDRPLLVLDRVGEGRVALLASDHAWLWSRGLEGGGPQLELLRRLANWMMKEPDLEEEALTATAEGQLMTIQRRTLGSGELDVEISGPDGFLHKLPMTETSLGIFSADYTAPEPGLYRLSQGDKKTVIALGTTSPREYMNPVATTEFVMPAVNASNGGVFPITNGVPSIRNVRSGRPAAGRDWIGLTPRDAFTSTDARLFKLLPAPIALFFVVALTLMGWLREGRK